MTRMFVAALFVSLAAYPAAHAQTSMPPGQVTPFKDTSMVKPPAGSKVAIVEFEDLECPACSRAFPIVHDAMNKYKIPLVRRDFPLRMHLWSHEAAVNARYMQDKISPAFADDYRRQVFASQYKIASREDLHNFTTKYMQDHGSQLPFVVDPAGQFAKEVDADESLGEKLGLQETPTIFVATAKSWVQIKDVMQLYAAIDQALEQTKNMAPEKASAAHSTHVAAKTAVKKKS